MKEVDRWLELYETHDKYTFVGYLVDDPVDDIIEKIDDEDAEGAEETVDLSSGEAGKEESDEETVELADVDIQADVDPLCA